MVNFRKCQGLGFAPICGEAGIFSDTCDSFGLSPHVIVSFGGCVGTIAEGLALGLPVCNVEEGCYWPFSICLKGWYATADGVHWHPIHATGGGLRGGIGTWGRLFSGCRRVNFFNSLRDAMDAETFDPTAGNFCFLRQPDVCDFPFLLALDGMTCRIIFPPFQSCLPWARAWLRFLREVGEPRAVPLPRAALVESLELKGVAAI